MLNLTLDPHLEQTEPFTTRAFQMLQARLPGVSFGTHAGLTILLRHLLELSQRHASVDRWFRCGDEALEADLGLPARTQQRLIELLVSIGYIEVQYINPRFPARYLRTNLTAIEHDFLTSPTETPAHKFAEE